MINPRELFGKDYDKFREVDPFNPQNEVEGYISRKPNEYYGALIITGVNGKPVPEQLIMSSPKMHYPFGKTEDDTRSYSFPPAKSIEIYEKIDGTCVIAYPYTNGPNTFITYKTRLRPFLSSSRFGDFLGMWREVSPPYLGAIKDLIETRQCNLVFELYGNRNPHLILYKNQLDIALLFGVTGTGRILSPSDLGNVSNIPVVTRSMVIDKDYVHHYKQIQRELEEKLTEEDDGYYSGTEGTVWYLHSPDGKCIQIKNKPETIEAIHFASGAGGISKNSVITTCWNAFENTDTLTAEFLNQLLLEEFTLEDIESNRDLIERCIAFVTGEAEFRERVLSEYRATGKNILLNKQEVMRSLSAKFDKGKMRKVYGIITAFG